jgi:hypothetical protein
MKLMHYGFGTEIKTIMVTLVMRFTLLGSLISVHQSSQRGYIKHEYGFYVKVILIIISSFSRDK